ncbi:hypothetical protein GCM10010992_10930 [Cloacibacterium rupense]|uniref:Uncharacterized protein n=1 Tax=Cloacibacterium rupense TaxID=517423 RepID=A0ABQ2NK06_9FLAO|nr:hypothetical protein [Cloacibacterium rupense]GGP03256.1 hypothetical protein GCM10010992_10930 [Cloacibacterium rupense]
MIKVKINDIVVGSILLFFLGGIYYLANDSTKSTNAIINSRVKGLYRDRSNHGQGTILMSDGKKIPIRDDFYYKIKIGDSLVKEKGKLTLKVIRKDSIFNFNLDNDNATQ